LLLSHPFHGEAVKWMGHPLSFPPILFPMDGAWFPRCPNARHLGHPGVVDSLGKDLEDRLRWFPTHFTVRL
jgi:hypothetical protein